MLTIALLGQLNVQLDGQPADLSLRPVQMLLVYLLLNRGVTHRRERLAGLLWPDYTEASARKNLRNTVYRLRKVIGDDYLLADRTTLAFDTGSAFQLDVAQLEEETDPSDSQALIRAVSVYQGELLPGFYEDWVFVERERLRALFERRMQQLVESLETGDRWTETLTWAEHWIAQGQAPEPAYRALMQAHAGLGDLASMAYTYQRCVQMLDEELGMQPSAETERLYQELQAGNAEAIPTPAEPIANDAAELEQRPRQNLPLQTTLFVGREKELAKLRQLLVDERSGRLVTVMGPGGIGKTRLALETAAATRESFTDGVYFVPLAPVSDVQHIVTTLAESLGLHPLQGDPWQELLNYLSLKQLLLVMDNFEHLLTGSSLVADILHTAPQVKILTTSRERLNLSGESVFLLPGMAYPETVPLTETTSQPSNGDLNRYEAVKLLLDSAYLTRPGLEVSEQEMIQVVRICRLVQGMPLALVLAAGWLEMLSFKEIGDEITQSLDFLESEARDMPERQHSVRAAFNYSWQRLDLADQEVFRRLAVFRGGFTRQAAQQVTGAGLRTLRTLLNKSLISTNRSDRYAIHELLRQFAEEKLEMAGEAETIREAHSLYYLDALAQREADLKGRRQSEALKEIETDLDNVRVAWKWASLRADEVSLGRALESLTLFYYMRSRNQEGVILFEPARQNLAAKGEPGRLLGRLLASIGLLQAQFAEGNPELKIKIEASLDIAEAGGDQAEIAFAYLALGHYYSLMLSDFGRALTSFKESLERYQVLDERFYMAHLLHRIGHSFSHVTGQEDFLNYTRQSLELAHQIGAKSDEANALGNLGSGAFALGDYTQAEKYFHKAITLSREMGNRLIEAHSLIQQGLSHLLDGRFDQAQVTAAAGLAIASELGSSTTQAYGLAVLSMQASLRGDYERGRQLGNESLTHSTNNFGDFLRQWALATAYCGLDQPEQAWTHLLAGLKLSHGYRWHGITTWMLPVLVIIQAQQGQSEQAVEFLSLFLNHPLSATKWTEDWAILNEWQTGLEEKLGTEGYQAAWERGRELDLVTTIEALLAEGNKGRGNSGAR